MNSKEKMHLNPDPEKDEVAAEEKEEENEDTIQEYVDVDQTLDQIALYLDQLEEKNDGIYARLQDLLESNRQTRLEMEAKRLSEEKDDPDSSKSGACDDNKQSKESNQLCDDGSKH